MGNDTRPVRAGVVATRSLVASPAGPDGECASACHQGCVYCFALPGREALALESPDVDAARLGDRPSRQTWFLPPGQTVESVVRDNLTSSAQETAADLDETVEAVRRTCGCRCAKPLDNGATPRS